LAREYITSLAVIIAILSGAELAGVAGIFLAIPVVAILTVSYRPGFEHRGKRRPRRSSGTNPAGKAWQRTIYPSSNKDFGVAHPDVETTPGRYGPRTTGSDETGELKMPVRGLIEARLHRFPEGS